MKKILFFILIFGWIAVPAYSQTKDISFENIFDGTFSPSGIQQLRWMNDGKYFTTLEPAKHQAEIRKYNILTGKYEVLLGSSSLNVEGRKKPVNIEGYQFSPDEKKLLIKTDVQKIWRRSTREHYFVYNLETGVTAPLTQSDTKLRYARFSPNGGKVAFVRKNDLYIVNLKTGNEARITHDGKKNSIINGAADWVYEEEFGIAKGWKWSPDGSKIAFYRFDESQIKEFSFTKWGTLYPTQVTYKYPMAGENNSVVKIGVYDLGSAKTTCLDLGKNTDQYIPRINWSRNSNVLAIRRMNRLQNKQDLMLADVETGSTHIIKTETAKAWVDINDGLTFLENGKQFIYASEESGYNHLYLYSMDGRMIRQLTKGDWEVSRFLGYNKDSGKIYYESTEASPLERQSYSINIDGTHKKRLSDDASWVSINMSSDFKYYIQTASSPSKLPQYSLHKSNGEQVRVLEDNADLQEKMSQYNMPEKDFIKIPLPQATLNGYILKPHNFNSSKKYPVLMYVYGGPGSQTVKKNFPAGQQAMWHRYLTTLGYVVVSVDNRGTGARGRDFEKQVYKKLGQYEVDDQIDAARYLAKKYNYIDKDRIGIWGWSYGGFMSTLALAKGADTFSTAIAVSPVTNWRFYDTIYTERFMQTPQMNPEGYAKGSPLTYADQIKGNFLLVHGTGDDNVHFQNSVALVNRLINTGVQFRTMYYPNRSHSIYGGYTRHHLFKMLTNFITENL